MLNKLLGLIIGLLLVLVVLVAMILWNIRDTHNSVIQQQMLSDRVEKKIDGIVQLMDMQQSQINSIEKKVDRMDPSIKEIYDLLDISVTTE